MEDSKILKRQPHLFIIIPVIIIIISASFYILFFYEASSDEITALDGQVMAEAEALSWRDEVQLVHVTFDYNCHNGKSNGWH